MKIAFLNPHKVKSEQFHFASDNKHKVKFIDTYFSYFNNVPITSHQAFLTYAALKNIAETTIYNIDCWYKGIKSKNELI